MQYDKEIASLSDFVSEGEPPVDQFRNGIERRLREKRARMREVLEISSGYDVSLEDVNPLLVMAWQPW